MPEAKPVIEQSNTDNDLTRDEADNTFFSAYGNNYKIPRLNWRLEEKFLIAMGQSGFSQSDGKVDLVSGGNPTILRETILPMVFHEKSTNKFAPLNEAYQTAHFKSIHHTYKVMEKAIEAIGYFLEQAQE